MAKAVSQLSWTFECFKTKQYPPKSTEYISSSLLYSKRAKSQPHMIYNIILKHPITAAVFFEFKIDLLNSTSQCKCQILDESDLKKTNPNPRNNIKWKGNKPKSPPWSPTIKALYIPKAKQSIRRPSNMTFIEIFFFRYLFFFQLSDSALILNFGVRTKSLRFPKCPSKTAIEL